MKTYRIIIAVTCLMSTVMTSGVFAEDAVVPPETAKRLKISESGREAWPVKDITDGELAFLKDEPRLRVLYLYECGITDAGMTHLAELTELQSLYIAKCKRVTDAGMKKLKEALPGCKFVTQQHLTPGYYPPADPPRKRLGNRRA